MPAISIGGSAPIVTYQHRTSNLSASEWSTLYLASFGGFCTIYNQDPTYDLLVSFPPAQGGITGISGTGATDPRGVIIPAGGWREFPLDGYEDDCGGVPAATSCGIWGGAGASHPFDVVQSVGSNSAGNT